MKNVLDFNFKRNVFNVYVEIRGGCAYILSKLLCPFYFFKINFPLRVLKKMQKYFSHSFPIDSLIPCDITYEQPPSGSHILRFEHLLNFSTYILVLNGVEES